jgi:hypothetical protein
LHIALKRADCASLKRFRAWIFTLADTLRPQPSLRGLPVLIGSLTFLRQEEGSGACDR